MVKVMYIYIYIISADRAENGKALSAFLSLAQMRLTSQQRNNITKKMFSNVYVKKRTNKECKNNSH